MFKKINNLKLIILLAVFVGVYFIVDYTGGRKKSKSLRSELVQIDTSKVTSVKIEAKGEIVDLDKDGDNWKVALKNGKSATASLGSIKSALGALLTVKPSRMASRKESKWGEYQVDSTGTRVQVYEGGDKTLDIILGKFGVQGQNSYHTYVRLSEDKEVYIANNFMNFSVPSDASSYRNQQLTGQSLDSLTAITFNYPADSSVQLSNNAGVWAVNGQLADSASVASYISNMEYVNGKDFEDESESLTLPLLTARYSFANRDDITIEAYQKEGSWVFHSSENEESYFKDEQILDDIFKGQSTFLK